MATKFNAPATAKCPSCGSEAKWNGHSRYICRATYTQMVGEREVVVQRHGYDGVEFTGDVGVCEGRISGNGWRSTPCDKQGKPEPATKDRYDYSTGEITQEPNKRYDSDTNTVEGKFYCGIHSPSKKAAKEAAKTKSEREARMVSQMATAGRINAETQAVNEAATLLELLIITTTDSDDLRKAVALLKAKALKQIEDSRYARRYY